MAEKPTPEERPKPTIAEVLARNNSPDSCPLYDEHIFNEPYSDCIRDDIDKRHEERLKALHQELMEEEQRLEALLKKKEENQNKVKKMGRRKEKKKEEREKEEKEKEKEDGPSNQDNIPKDRNWDIYVDAEQEGYRDFINLFRDMVNAVPPGVEIDQPGFHRRLRRMRDSTLAGEDILDFLGKHIPR